jgi:hypothetical protein
MLSQLPEALEEQTDIPRTDLPTRRIPVIVNGVESKIESRH